MYTLIYRLYFHLKQRARKDRDKGRQPSGMVQKARSYCEWFYNIPLARWYEKFPSRRSGVTSRKRRQKIIVSLTTYPKRIGTIWLTIETLLRQSMKPDEVILWLADTQFPNGLADLPEKLLRLRERGLTIRFCEDLRSHKKYFHALVEYPHDLVVLADDDMFYPRDTIRKLMEMHRKWPEDICCMTAQVIEPDLHTLPSRWRNPRLDEHTLQHSARIQAFTGSGTLIPPQALHADAFDRDRIRALCLHADDLWVTFMALRKGTKITTSRNWRPFPISIYGTAEGSLYYINAEGNQNDVQWKNLLDNYDI